MSNMCEGSFFILEGKKFTAACHYLDNGGRIWTADGRRLQTHLRPDSSDIEFPEGFFAEEVAIDRLHVQHQSLGLFNTGPEDIEYFYARKEFFALQ